LYARSSTPAMRGTLRRIARVVLELTNIPGARGQGRQSTLSPVVRVNVALVQKLAALRYQHWYSSTFPPITPPCTEMGASPAPGWLDAPTTFVVLSRRTIVPPAHLKPSPNAAPAASVPWK